MARRHALTLHQDAAGWDYGVCACGWRSSFCCDIEDVAEQYGNHRATADDTIRGEGA